MPSLVSMHVAALAWIAGVAIVPLTLLQTPSAPPFSTSKPVDARERTTSASTDPAALPSSVDLRPRLEELKLAPRAQGPRGTCSIFTTCEAIEFAIAMRDGGTERLSPEFVNWAAGQVNGHPSDGNFFHNAIAGFERFGICTDSVMPYEKGFDAARAPSEEAKRQGERMRDEARETIAFRWIVPWASGKVGVDESQFAEIKRVLAMGYPVAAGSGHSRLLVGYRDDSNSEAATAGGVFITEDSALHRFDEVTYEFVRKQVNDVFWVEALPATAMGSK